MLGTPESERLKVTALNLWEAARFPLIGRFPASRPTSPTASPLFKKLIFSYYDIAFKEGGRATYFFVAAFTWSSRSFPKAYFFIKVS